MSKKISALIPAFNAGRFIEKAIESTREQTRPVDEIIVVDDGSTDDTAEIVERSPRITLIRQDNAGPSAARNAGFPHTSGDYIAFLDADDFWTPNKIEKQLAVFDARPDIDFCFCRLSNFLEDGIERPWWVPKDSIGNAWDYEQLSATLVKRDAYERVGVFDEKAMVGGDFDWFMRAKDAGLKAYVIEEVLVQRRIHDENVSHKRDQADSLQSVVKAIHRSIKRKREERD